MLQFGAGNFLRGFVDQLIQVHNAAGGDPLGITVVKVTRRPDTITGTLQAQDGLFTVRQRGLLDGEVAQRDTLVSAVRQVLNAHTDFEAYRAAYLDPALQLLISNTTEAGIVYDAEADLTLQPPHSFPAKVTALLYDRYRHFDGAPEAGLAILCCELIEHNGATLRRYVLQHAAAAQLPIGFRTWVESSCRFYDSLVDRIVTAPTAAELPGFEAEWGYRDQASVVTEWYTLWAISGPDGLQDLLPLDRIDPGVKFVSELTSDRIRKVRVLNGLHTTMAQIGPLLGIETVAEALEDATLGPFLRQFLNEEILPTLPGTLADNQRYATEIWDRFANPMVQHRLSAIALNSVAKWRTRVWPTVQDNLTAGRGCGRAAAGLAALLWTYAGQGPVAPNDDPTVVTLIRSTFTPADLTGWTADILPQLEFTAPALIAATAAALTRIAARGMAAAIEGVKWPS